MGKHGIIDWFKFESKAQREKREKRYYGRMYPFGEAQHQWEIDTLKELFPDAVKRIEEVHFDLLTLREAILNADLDEDDDDYESLEDGIRRWEKSDITRAMMKKGRLPAIKAMAFLENQAPQIEAFPSVELILKEAEKYRGM